MWPLLSLLFVTQCAWVVHCAPLIDCTTKPLPDGCPCDHKYDCKTLYCAGFPATCGGSHPPPGPPSPPGPPTPPAPPAPAGQPMVVTPLGEVRGIQYKGANAFLGIPYAEPPKRFSPPAPKTSWSSPLDATSFGEICLQHNATDPSILQGLNPILFPTHLTATSTRRVRELSLRECVHSFKCRLHCEPAMESAPLFLLYHSFAPPPL